MELTGKVALVTGAAAGLGKAAADRLAAAGATLVLTDVDESGAAAAASLPGAIFLQHDVSNEEDWARVISEVDARYGRLDVLVNNAGITLMGSIEEMDLAGFRRTLDVDLVGVFLGCKAALPLMRRTGGSIINISSISGLKASANLVAYNAAKAGVTLMTKSIALHCAAARTGIRCNSVHPGVIRTAMLEKVMAQVSDPKALMDGFVATHPIGHIGEPDDIAEMVLYLASDRSKFITGAAMIVDGGATM